MNYKKATTILGLPNDWNSEMLKKAYRKSALRYHPDKNPSTEASLQFDLVKRAFEYLVKTEQYNRKTDSKNMSEINPVDGFDDITCLFDKIRPFDPDKLQKLFGACKTVVGITKDIVKEAISKKENKEERYELEVNLQQMLDDNVYMLKHNEKPLLVPLWFDEIYFDKENESDDIVSVSIIPQLPSNVKLNESNHLIVEVPMKDLSSFDVKQFQSCNVEKIDLDLSKMKTGGKITLWNVGLLKISDTVDNKINTKERQGVTFVIV